MYDGGILNGAFGVIVFVVLIIAIINWLIASIVLPFRVKRIMFAAEGTLAAAEKQIEHLRGAAVLLAAMLDAQDGTSPDNVNGQKDSNDDHTPQEP
jgi:hypothetical protein